MTEAAAASGRQRLALFGEPDFRRLWLAGLVFFVVRWLETLAIAVFVYQQTGSAFLVAMLGMLRLLPLGLFGAFLGALAERVERHAALAAIIGVLLLTAASLAVVERLGLLAVWHLAVASFVNGICWAADNPVRRAMLGQVAGPARLSTAMSIDVGSNIVSRLVGPVAGGVLLAAIGIGGAFALGAALYAVSLVATLRLACRNGPAAVAPAPVSRRIAEGIAAVRHDRRLTGILTVTVVFNLFGFPFTSMIPVIAKDRLGLAPEGIGLLAGMDGLGALCGAVAIALWARPSAYARCYVGGLAAYLAAMPAFALAPHPLAAGVALAANGAAQASFSTMQATLIYLAAPPEMRSRVLGLLTVCIGLGPIGFVQVGLLAELLGAHWAVVTIGLEGLVALALARPWLRAI